MCFCSSSFISGLLFFYHVLQIPIVCWIVIQFGKFRFPLVKNKKGKSRKKNKGSSYSIHSIILEWKSFFRRVNFEHTVNWWYAVKPFINLQLKAIQYGTWGLKNWIGQEKGIFFFFWKKRNSKVILYKHQDWPLM